MLPRLKRFWSGYIREVCAFFENGWEYISSNNLHMLIRGSNITVGIVLLYLLASLLTDTADSTRAAYAVYLLVYASFCYFIHRYESRLKWRTRVIQLLCLLFLASLFLMVVYMGTVGERTEPGIYFAPFTIVLSMVFILRIWQNAAIVTAATVLFVCLSSQYKDYTLFRLDASMAAAAWLLSMIVDMEILHLRLRDYRLRNELLRLSCTDSLTGLMNKSTAESAARAYLARTGAHESSALFVIDLDQFKQINDLLGHRAGDEALEVVGETLLKLFRAQDIVGRVGGDEFVALMKNTCDRQLIARRAANICRAVQHTRLQNYSMSLTCSIGVAICPAHGNAYDALFQKADEQLYLAKHGGKNGFRLAL